MEELVQKLKDLWSESSQGLVSQYIGREHPQRIDLVLGEDAQSKISKIEELKKTITQAGLEKGKIEQELINLLHFHPVEPNLKNLTPNAQNNMNLIEFIWNNMPQIIEVLEKKDLKEEK